MPQSLRPEDRRSLKLRRLTSSTRRGAAVPPRKSPLLHAVHVAHGPSSLASRASVWTTSKLGKDLLYIGSFRSLRVRFSVSFCFRSSALYSTTSSFYFSFYHRTSPHLPHPRNLCAWCRAFSKFTAFWTPLLFFYVAMRVCPRQGRFHVPLTIFPPPLTHLVRRSLII